MKHNDADFYKYISYKNNYEYLKKLIEMNFTPEEINNKGILDYGCGVGDASLEFAKFPIAYDEERK